MAKILIVDESAQTRRMLSDALGSAHEVVGQLSDGYAAASEVEETRPDVVIIDHRMPIIDGADVTRQIKALFPHVLVVGFISSDESAEALTEAGADVTFMKSELTALQDYLETRASSGAT